MKTILVDAVNTFVIDGNINTDMKAMLDTFPHRKIIVTNANLDEQKIYGLISMPYEMFTLSHNPNKPDPLYFTTLLQKYGIHPSQVIYFEHNPAAVMSARLVWIQAFQYDHKSKNIDAVKEFIKTHI
jgi:HAD superfamily hydrolase (TIGR01509 family)